MDYNARRVGIEKGLNGSFPDWLLDGNTNALYQQCWKFGSMSEHKFASIATIATLLNNHIKIAVREWGQLPPKGLLNSCICTNFPGNNYKISVIT